jgi:hypothetical protein
MLKPKFTKIPDTNLNHEEENTHNYINGEEYIEDDINDIKEYNEYRYPKDYDDFEAEEYQDDEYIEEVDENEIDYSEIEYIKNLQDKLRNNKI